MKLWKSLKLRIPLVALTGIIAISVLLLGLFYQYQNREFKKEIHSKFNQFGKLFDKQLDINKQNLKMAMEVMLNDEETLKLFYNRDRETLQNKLIQLYNKRLKPEYDISQFQFHLPPATSFLRLHKPAKFGDDLSTFRNTVLKVNKDKEPVAGLEVGRGGPGLRIVYPVNYNNEHLGSVEFGGSIYHLLLIAKALDMEYAIGINEDVFLNARRFTDEANDIVIGNLVYYKYSNDTAKKLLRSINHDDFTEGFEYNNKDFLGYYYTLKDFSGAEVGKIALIRDITENTSALFTNTINNFIIVLIASLILMGILWVFFKKFFTDRMNKIITFVKNRELKVKNNFINPEDFDSEEFIMLSESLKQMSAQIDKQLQYLENLPLPVMLVDKQYNMEYMNIAGQKLLDKGLDDLVGKKCYDFMKTGHCNTEKCAVAQALKLEKTITEETKAYPNNHDLSIMYTAYPARDIDGSVSGALEYIADITEMKNRQEYLSRSTDTMVQAMERFSDGDLTVNVLPEIQNDQIGKLFNAFNKTIQTIQQMILQLIDAVDATASATAEISASAEEMAAGVQEQSSQSTEIANAVEHMAEAIVTTAHRAKSTADMAVNAGEIAQTGGNVVETTIKGMIRIAEVVNESAFTVEKLGDSSTQIGEIIQVIDDIADQTNLLALNAAIEAARAGEQGRGFAVVADEVRKLAERTSNATKEISAMIKQIQTDTKGAVESIKIGNDEVDKGRVLAEDAGNSLKEIISTTRTVVTNVQEVASTNEQQSSAAEQISRSIEGISSVISETAGTTQQIASAAEDLNRLTDNLQILIQQFKVSSEPMVTNHYNGNGKLLTE